MDYTRVIDFIGQHLDDPLDLDTLAKVAGFSKYHFHRLFTLQMGIPLQGYIKWLRLKRAAHQLTAHKEKTILTIALRAGFCFSRSV
jgi:AraC family transcriptional regulator